MGSQTRSATGSGERSVARPPPSKPSDMRRSKQSQWQMEIDENRLMEALKEFHQARGDDFKVPLFQSKPLDVVKLWKSVQEAGGFDKVTDDKQWAHIGRLFNPPRSCTNLSFLIKKQYIRCFPDGFDEVFGGCRAISGPDDSRRGALRSSEGLSGKKRKSHRRSPEGSLAAQPSKKRMQTIERATGSSPYTRNSARSKKAVQIERATSRLRPRSSSGLVIDSRGLSALNVSEHDPQLNRSSPRNLEGKKGGHKFQATDSSEQVTDSELKDMECAEEAGLSDPPTSPSKADRFSDDRFQRASKKSKGSLKPNSERAIVVHDGNLVEGEKDITTSSRRTISVDNGLAGDGRSDHNAASCGLEGPSGEVNGGGVRTRNHCSQANGGVAGGSKRPGSDKRAKKLALVPYQPRGRPDAQKQTSGWWKRSRPFTGGDRDNRIVRPQVKYRERGDGYMIQRVLEPDGFEVFLLVPGFNMDELVIQCYNEGRVVVEGEPKDKAVAHLWGVESFRKEILLPTNIAAKSARALLTLHGQLYIRVTDVA
ncbi:hypothetical protein BSKO_00314 [Bryopsis sp. KO-2023]|nr:hypothetical protein BSKO_00314 [Bryopsis sp. KO-2023]